MVRSKKNTWFLVFLFVSSCFGGFGDDELSVDGARWIWNNNSQTFSIAASGSMSESIDYSWPPADGVNNGNAMITNSSGVLTFGNPVFHNDWSWVGSSVTASWSGGPKVIEIDNAEASLVFAVSASGVLTINGNSGNEGIEIGDGSVAGMTFDLFGGDSLATFANDVEITGLLKTGLLQTKSFDNTAGSVHILDSSTSEFEVAPYYGVVTETPASGTNYQLFFTAIPTASADYEFEVDGTSPDTFKWRKDTGTGFGTYTTGVPRATFFTTLENNIKYAFNDRGTDTWVIGDLWEFTVNHNPSRTFTVDTLNGNVFIEAGMLFGEPSVGNTAQFLTTSNDASAFVINNGVNSNIYFDIDTVTGSEKIDLGNASDDPIINFLGDGAFNKPGTGTTTLGGDLDVDSVLVVDTTLDTVTINDNLTVADLITVGDGTTLVESVLIKGSLKMQDRDTDMFQKTGKFYLGHYDNSEEDISVFGGVASLSSNELKFGGGSSQQNAATDIKFFTAANTTTVEGTECLHLLPTCIAEFNFETWTHSATGGFNRALRVGPFNTTVNEGGYIEFTSSSADGFGAQIGGIREGAGGANALIFLTGTNAQQERMRISDAGLVTIATDLTVNGNTILGDNAADTITITGIPTLANGQELRFSDTGDSNYVGFKAPALVGNQIWVLPDADGKDGDVVFTDGAGNLKWGANASTRAFTFSSPSGGSGTTYAGGHYRFGSSDNDFNPGINFGTANGAYGDHIFLVAAAGGGGGTDTVIRINGTTIDDEANRTAGVNVDLTLDDAGAAGAYYETSEKWIGQVSITKLSGPDLLCNYGGAKYWDDNNEDFKVEGVDVTWLGGANDGGANLILRHHKPTGWTYNAASTPTPPTPVATMNTDYVTEINVINGEEGAWKRTDLAEIVSGSADEGTIIEIITTANKTFEIGNFLMRVVPQ